MADASGWVAAGAAILAAGVVAWQSWETRRAAQASEAAVATANEALELTRQQAAEVVRARIDAATPTIIVHMPEEPTWPPLEPSLYLGGEPQSLPIGPTADPMHMPRDRAREIMVRTPVEIINESAIHVSIEVYELQGDAGAAIPGPIRLEPREPYKAWFAVTRTLEDWISVYREREAGRPGNDASGVVRYLDPADTGAIDRWELTLSGCPVEQVPELEGGWRLITAPGRGSGRPGAIGMGPVFRRRTYYLSKSRDEKLPD